MQLGDALDTAMQAARHMAKNDLSYMEGQRPLRSAIIAAMKAFGTEANRIAEEEMLRTHTLEGAHGRAIATLLAALDALEA